MANRHVLVLCLLVLTAGCASLGETGSSTETGDPRTTGATTPTATTMSTGTPSASPFDLPSGVDPVEVDRRESLSDAQRDAFDRARGSDEWVLIDADAAQRLDAITYVHADGRLWETSVQQGTDALSIAAADDTDHESVTDFGNLTAEQQALFESAVGNSPHVEGPDEEFVQLPAHVEYRGQVYAVSRGTESWGQLGLDVDPYDSNGTDG